MVEQIFKDGESCGWANCLSPYGCPKCERKEAAGVVKFVDGGLVVDLSKDQQCEEFFLGLKDGVSRRFRGSVEFHYCYRKGYAKGEKLFREAMDEFREEIGHRLTTEIVD
jgi:hypothetical protein